MKRIGVFSGTFDPFHIAHLEACLVAKAACELDSTLVVIEKKPHRKYDVTSFEKRYNMVDLATASFPSFRVLDVGNDNVTINNILPLLNKQFTKAEYWLIIGSDTVRHLRHWQNIEELFRVFKVCVILRENKDKKTVSSNLNKLQKDYKDFTYKLLPEVWSPVASTKIRRQIKGTGYSSLVHRDVLKYILKNNIY